MGKTWLLSQLPCERRCLYRSKPFLPVSQINYCGIIHDSHACGRACPRAYLQAPLPAGHRQPVLSRGNQRRIEEWAPSRTPARRVVVGRRALLGHDRVVPAVLLDQLPPRALKAVRSGLGAGPPRPPEQCFGGAAIRRPCAFFPRLSDHCDARFRRQARRGYPPGDVPMTLCAFDLLVYDGRSFMQQRLELRLTKVSALLAASFTRLTR